MAKIIAGQKMPDFAFNTPFETGRTLAETARRTGGKTALVFLRYYGCTLCQYDIHQFAAQHDKIAAAGGQMLVALQSDPEKLAGELTKESLPFDILCDPGQNLYKEFDIAPAESQAKMADAATMGKIAKAKLAGFKHGDYEGDEMQLPAVFVVDPELNVTYAHYGKTVSDIPTPEELAELLR